jgi:hypothetical protein
MGPTPLQSQKEYSNLTFYCRRFAINSMRCGQSH